MKILLVNVDSRWNMAIRKMYNYFRAENEVEMIDLGFGGYPHKKTKVIDGAEYDKVFVSNIFDINQDRVQVINCENVEFGGIGSKNPKLQLPCEIEQTEPFYFPDETTSYGFVTRGCIRNCWWVWLLGVLGVLGLLGYFLVLSVLLELLATLGRQSWQDEHTPSPFGYSP